MGVSLQNENAAAMGVETGGGRRGLSPWIIKFDIFY